MPRQVTRAQVVCNCRWTSQLPSRGSGPSRLGGWPRSAEARPLAAPRVCPLPGLLSVSGSRTRGAAARQRALLETLGGSPSASTAPGVTLLWLQAGLPSEGRASASCPHRLGACSPRAGCILFRVSRTPLAAP